MPAMHGVGEHLSIAVKHSMVGNMIWQTRYHR